MQNLVKLIFVCCLIGYILNVASIVEGCTTPFNYDAYPTRNNPLKGFFPYVGEAEYVYNQKGIFPFSLEFEYFSMAELMTGPTTFDFTRLNKVLTDVARRNHQLVFRVAVDLPCESAYKPPAYLNEKMTSYSAYGCTGKTPAYSDALIDAMVALIKKMASVYDYDTRIAAIQVGFLGLWGEWHAEVTTGGRSNVNVFPSKEKQVKVLNAFNSSFVRTHILVSTDQLKQASKDLTKNYRIGIHDDSFGYTTQSYTIPLLTNTQTTEKWRRVPFAGEVYPDFQEQAFTSTANADKVMRDTIQTHSSFQLINGIWYPKIKAGTNFNRALNILYKKGYNFFVPSVTLYSNGIDVQIINNGSAPFYHSLKLVVKVVGGTSIRSNTDLAYLYPSTTASTVFIGTPAKFFPFGKQFQIEVSFWSDAILPTQSIRFAVKDSENGLFSTFSSTCNPRSKSKRSVREVGSTLSQTETPEPLPNLTREISSNRHMKVTQPNLEIEEVAEVHEVPEETSQQQSH